MTFANSLARDLPWQPRVGLRCQAVISPLTRSGSPSMVATCDEVRPPDDLRAIESPAVLLAYLRELCAFLDARLDRPLRVIDKGGIVDVQVLDTFAYSINKKVTRVNVVHLREGRPSELLHGTVELHRPMRTAQWIRLVIQGLGLPSGERTADLFTTVDASERIGFWLVRAADRLLQDDPRFQRLRAQNLPCALGRCLDPTLMSLALMSRQLPGPWGVTSDHYNRVWGYEVAYRRVAAVAPQLLPLWDTFPGSVPMRSIESPLAVLKAELLRCELKPATWRYLLQYGARIFRVAWDRCRGASPLGVAIQFLGLMQDAGLPPPPPPSMQRVWFDLFDELMPSSRLLPSRTEGVPPEVLRAACEEAERMRRDEGIKTMPCRFASVALWAQHTKPRLDRHQRKAGWRTLERRAQAWRAQQEAERRPINRWQPWFPGHTWRGWEMVAIDSAYELVRQGQVMRNCIADYLEQCIEDKVRLYAVYPPTGKRKRPVAHIGVSFDLKAWRWVPLEARGVANSEPPFECQVLMRALVKIFNVQEARGLNRRRPE